MQSLWQDVLPDPTWDNILKQVFKAFYIPRHSTAFSLNLYHQKKILSGNSAAHIQSPLLHHSLWIISVLTAFVSRYADQWKRDEMSQPWLEWWPPSSPDLLFWGLCRACYPGLSSFSPSPLLSYLMASNLGYSRRPATQLIPAVPHTSALSKPCSQFSPDLSGSYLLNIFFKLTN